VWFPYNIYNARTIKQFQMGKEFEDMLKNTIGDQDLEFPDAQQEDNKPTDLGKVETLADKRRAKVSKSAEEVDKVGFQPVPREILASKGVFYPTDLRISARPATTREIIHYSGMDETDFKDIGTKIQSLVDSCTRIYMKGNRTNCKDLLEVDRLFLFFLIRDYTFSTKENILYHHANCPHCGTVEKIEITSNTLGFSNINQKLVDKWDKEQNAFVLDHPKLPNMPLLYPPTIGVINWIFDYVQKQELKKRRGEGGYYDTAFLTHLQFLVSDWRHLSESHLEKINEAYVKLDHNHIAAIRMFAKKLNIGVEPKMERRCGSCDGQYESLVRFPDGWATLFDDQDILGELF